MPVSPLDVHRAARHAKASIEALLDTGGWHPDTPLARTLSRTLDFIVALIEQTETEIEGAQRELEL